MEALFLSHFFPAGKPFYWAYAGVLWWATMYLSHHYLIDLTGGACLSVIMFYVTMPEQFKDSDQIQWGSEGMEGYELVNGRVRELDLDEEIRKLEERGDNADEVVTIKEDEESAIKGVEAEGSVKPKTKPKRSVSWGETKVLGEEEGEEEGDIGMSEGKGKARLD